MEQREITTQEGQANYPQNDNDVLELIETIARQNIKGLKSFNKLADGLKRIDVENGAVLEEAVIKMAESRAFDKNDYSRAPLDPQLVVKYFNNWVARTFQTTIRKDDIRKIIANKGAGVEGVATEILDTLTQGEGHEDYVKCLTLLGTANFKDFSLVVKKKPKNMKGVLYMIRDMYNHLKYDNADLTDMEWISSTPEDDIRIAMTTAMSNLIDVSELADVLNLEKEKLFGKIVLADTSFDEDFDASKYVVYVYDINAIGCAIRKYKYDSEHVARGDYDNAYLHTEKMYFHCGLFKGAKLDCSDACEDAEGELVDEVTPVVHSVSITATGCTADEKLDVEEVEEGKALKGDIIANEGYTFTGGAISGTMGGEELTDEQFALADSKTLKVNIENVTGDIVISATAVTESK